MPDKAEMSCAKYCPFKLRCGSCLNAPGQVWRITGIPAESTDQSESGYSALMVGPRGERIGRVSKG